jgi:hypothetical protein
MMFNVDMYTFWAPGRESDIPVDCALSDEQKGLAASFGYVDPETASPVVRWRAALAVAYYRITNQSPGFLSGVHSDADVRAFLRDRVSPERIAQSWGD